jgi:tRNA dimethylallyltransferase
MPPRRHLVPTRTIGLTLDRDRLDERIAARTRRMWERGLVTEVEGLLPLGLEDGRTARTALGYAQAIAQLRGTLTEAEAIEETIVATRRFARRQLSWFRPDERIVWLPADAPDLLDRALAVLRGLPATSAAVPENG